MTDGSTTARSTTGRPMTSRPTTGRPMTAMLDTSVLISGLPEPVIAEIETYCSSMICRAELARGLASFAADPPQPKRVALRREFLRLLDAIPGFWLPFDAAAADGYGALTARPPSAMRQKDALIAGHALAAGLPLLTEDTGFSRFAAVEVRLLDRTAL